MENQTSGTTSQTTTEPRKVKIIPTSGPKKIIEVAEGTSWKDMKSILKREGYSLDNMKAVEGNNKHTLEHDDATLPEGDFKLFLMPYKSKSGADDTRSSIKALFADPATKAKAKEHFGNYTQKKNDDLKELFKTWNPGSIKVAETPKIEEKRKAPAKKAAKPRVAMPEKKADTVEDKNEPSLAEKVDFLYDYLGIKFGENNSKKVEQLVTPKKKNILEDDEDDDKLEREIKRGLNDIRK